MALTHLFDLVVSFSKKYKARGEFVIQFVLPITLPIHLLLGNLFGSPEPPPSKPFVTEYVYSSNENLDNLMNTGQIFLDSDQRLLAEAEINDLDGGNVYTKYEMYCYAINEIYARKGYSFGSAGRYYEFYSRFSWYTGNDNMTMEQASELFNAYEQANVDALARARGNTS